MDISTEDQDLENVRVNVPENPFAGKSRHQNQMRRVFRNNPSKTPIAG
jgi:hypothetical protein